MPYCILYVGEEEVARENGDWLVEGTVIRFQQPLAAADAVDRILIDHVNYRVTDYAAHVYSVEYDPIPEH